MSERPIDLRTPLGSAARPSSRGLAVGIAVMSIALALVPDGEAAPTTDLAGVVFVPQPVRGPVSPSRVGAEPPFVAADVPEISGVVDVGPDRVIAFWLDPLDVVAVRHDPSIELTMSRIVGDATAPSRLVEPGTRIDPRSTYLSQPPGRGDVWVVGATTPTRIRVDRPVTLSGRAVWDGTHQALVAWIDHGGARPVIPVADGTTALAAHLDGEEHLGRAIERTFPGVRAAVRAWRKAGAIAGITSIRPLVRPTFAVTAIDDLAGMSGELVVPGESTTRPYRRIVTPRTFQLDLEGPGTLRVEARAILPPALGSGSSVAPEPERRPAVAIVVRANGRRVAARALPAAYATTADGAVPPPAFPTRAPLRAVDGSFVGDRVAIAIALAPGRNSYTLAVEGAPIAIRATVGRLRARLRDVLGSDADVADLLTEAATSTGGDPVGERLVRRLAARRAGAEVPPAPVPPQLPPLLRVAWIAAASNADDSELAAMTGALAEMPATDQAAAWTLLADLVVRDTRAAALASEMRDAPPAALVPVLVAALPSAGLLDRLRNWRLGLLEIAWRRQPTDPALAFALRSTWRASEWTTITPVHRDSSLDAPPALRWLVETRPTANEPSRSWSPGDLIRLTPGRPRDVTAPPSLVDVARTPLLDVYVTTRRASPLRLDLDGVAFHAVSASAVERLSFAVPTGRHRIALDAPRETAATGWASLPPASAVAVEDVARIQPYWPISSTRFALPVTEHAAPISIALRVTTGKPVDVTVRFDVGAPVRLVVDPRIADPRAHALEDAPTVGGEVAAVVVLPATARVVRFDASEPERVFARVAVRRERAADPSATASAAPPQSVVRDATALARITTASMALLADPRDAAARMRRATSLIDAGEAVLAREDVHEVLRATRSGAATQDMIAAEEHLVARLEQFAEPSHVLLEASPDAALALAPAMVALAHAPVAQSVVDVADAVYRGAASPDAVVDPIAVTLVARDLARRGQAARSIRLLAGLYQRTAEWRVALEAVDTYVRAIGSADASAASVAGVVYGLATRLRGVVETPRVRRALAVAAAQTGWQTITSTSGNAGQEHVTSSEASLPPSPAVLVREAMLAAPWAAHAGHTLTAGDVATLDVDLPEATTVRVQIRCGRHARRSQAEPGCVVATTLDQQPRAGGRTTIPVDTVGEIDLGAIAKGRHVVEVGLVPASDGDAVSVRFVADRAITGLTDAPRDGRHPIRIEKRAKMFVAGPAPIEATILGGTTLWVQARALEPDGQTEREIDVVATPVSGEPVTATVVPPSGRSTARGDAGRSLTLSGAGDVFVVLPEPVAYRVEIRPRRGKVLARLARREDRRAGVPRVPGAWYVGAPETQPAFSATPLPLAELSAPLYAAPDTGSVGTWSVVTRAQRDSRPEEDVQPEAWRTILDAGLEYRRELSADRAWITTRGFARSRTETRWITGGAAELYLAGMPLGTNLQVAGAAFTQPFSNGQAWRARGELQLARRFEASDTITVIPTLGATLDRFNTDPVVVAASAENLDPDVFNTYRYAHDRALIGRLALRWMPLQDLVGWITTSAVTNATPGSFDHVDAALRLQHLASSRLGDVLVDLGYRPSYRLADDDRSDAYLRHQLSAKLEWSVWTGAAGRLAVTLWDDLFVSPGLRVNAIGAGLRFDLVSGRGLLDFAPDQIAFPGLLEHRCYAPLEDRR